MDDPASDNQETLDRLPSPAPLTARYEILGEAGSGGMGIVYKARDRETGAIVALKVLRPEIAADPQVMERFKNEVLLARKITHKNVCRIHEFNRTEGTAYISMEFVEGESLRHFLKRFGALPLLKVVQQICAGLREAHAQEVVHRDLKPENVMVDRSGNVKIMDFGIARSSEGALTQAGALVGTPAYMSPEQAEGKTADPRSDIYSLGLVLYEMFTGAAAFSGDTPFAVALKQIHETPPPPRELEPRLPLDIENLILKCLEKNPAKRFQSVEEVEAALTQKPADRSVIGEVADVPLPLHLTHWQRSDWLLVVAAIAGLALFFPFFERTSLAPRSKVSFDRSILRLKAQEYAQRLGAPLGGESEVGNDWNSDAYNYVAQNAGARAALELTNNPVPYWVWWVDLSGVRVWVDHRGALTGFERNFPAGPALERLSLEEARPAAEKALRTFFDRDPSSLTLEPAALDTWRGHPSVSLRWEERKLYQGLQRRYEVRFVGREIAVLNSWYERTLGNFHRASVSPNERLLPAVALGLVILILGFSWRRQVNVRARWRATVTCLGFVVGAWEGWRIFGGQDISFRTTFSAILGFASSLLLFYFSVALEQSVRRMAPAKFSSFVWLFDRRAASQPCGLAILRGTFVGLALLGVETFLVWWGTARLGMWLDSFAHISLPAQLLLASRLPSAHLVLFAGRDAWGATLIAFLAAFAARFVRRTWLATLVAAGLASFILFQFLGAGQPYPWKALLLFFDCLVLVWTFHRFDLLTIVWALFTFVFWWINYFMLVMFEPTGALEQWVAFAIWGLLVVAAGAVAFQSSLRAAYRRVAAAVE